ncbi:MAG: ABC-type transport auxiliary lipoprotein family protein [Pseudomonadota bacterium]|nr:ABC-type transport auxiliary lipoprotein family protein [Pseudomonadota bacterium]
MRQAGIRIGLLAMLLGLVGCGIVPDLKGPSNLFNLTPKSSFTAGLPRVQWQLVIDEPIAAGGLDTARIAVMPTPIEMKYFADASWTERAPRMVQTLLVESFENSGTIVAVGRQAIGLRSDFNLKTEVREFQVENFGAKVVRVRINAKLVRQPRQEIVVSRSFESTQPVADGTMQSAILAWDEALGSVLRQIVEWSITEGEASWNARRTRG